MAWTTQGTYHGRPSGSVNRASIAFPSIKSADAIVEGAETVTGNYRTTSGTPGGGLQSPRTVMAVPTSCGRSSRRGKGVKRGYNRVPLLGTGAASSPLTGCGQVMKDIHE